VLNGLIARPPLAKERLDVWPGDRVRIGLKRAWSDGTTALYPTAEELVERLIALENPEGLLLVPNGAGPGGYDAGMPQLLPCAVHALVAAGRAAQSFDGAVLFADLSGFTPLCDALMAGGDQGAEQVASTLASIFDPLLQAASAHGGDVLAFAGDSVTVGFTGMAAPLAAAVAAGRAALVALDSDPVRVVGGQRFEFSLRVGVAPGSYRVGISCPDQGLGLYWVRGAAVSAAVAAEQAADRGALSVVGPAPGPPGLVLPLPWLPDPPAALRTFLPVHRLAAGAAELRSVVVAYVLLDGVEKEQVLRRAVHVVFAARARFGAHILDLGFEDKGAALVLSWGVERRRENDVERALAMLLHLRTALAAIGLPPIRVGVSRRRMYVGLGGGSERGTLALYGRGVALAARLAVGCSPGEVWTDGPVARAGQRTHSLQPMGGCVLRGFAEPVPTHRLIRTRTAESTHTSRGVMLGRGAELARVEAHLASIRSGRGGMLVRIEGEAGVGKTLLIDSVQARNQAGVRWVRLSCDGVLRGPLNPVLRHLRALTGQVAGGPLVERRARFDAAWPHIVGPAGPELARARVFIEGLLGLAPPDSLWHELEPALRGANTLQALKDLVRGWCRSGPVVVVVDDVQWVDARTEAWLLSLTRNVESWPLGLLVVARPDTHATSLRPDAVVPVDALPPLAFDALAAARLGDTAAPELTRFLRDKTAGNPFFLEQLCDELAATHRLRTGPRGVALEPGESHTVPATVDDVCIARIDRLDEASRRVVQAAAVLGRRFAPAVLAALLGEADPRRLLAIGEQARLWARDADGLCSFRHGLLRDAAYGMLLHAHRGTLHGQAAEALQACYAGEEDAHAADIAAQLDDAGLAGQALSWWVRAVRYAASRHALDEVVAYADRAIALAPLSGVREQALVWDAVAVMVGALGVTGAREAGVSRVERVLNDPLLAPPSAIQRARIDARLSRLYGFVGRQEEAVVVATRALDAGRAAGDVSLQIDASKRLGVLLGQAGDPERGRTVMEQGLVLAERAGDLANQGSILNNLLTLRFSAGEVLSSAELDEALSLARAAGDRVSLNNMLANVGTFALLRGDVARGQGALRESLKAAAGLGQRGLEGHVSGLLGQSYLHHGQLPRARRYLERSRDLAADSGNLRVLGPAWVRLAALARAEDEPAAGLEAAREAARLAERARYLDLTVHAAGEVALCLLALERAADADAALGPARSHIAAHGLPGQVARHAAIEALVAVALGQPAVARLRRAESLAAPGHTTESEVSTLLARLDAALAD
jgi:predicted ATPase/class 3 adenylate cyclase